MTVARNANASTAHFLRLAALEMDLATVMIERPNTESTAGLNSLNPSRGHARWRLAHCALLFHRRKSAQRRTSGLRIEGAPAVRDGMCVDRP
jgi:hypothetical protein